LINNEYWKQYLYTSPYENEKDNKETNSLIERLRNT